MDFNFILLFIESIYLQFDIFGGEGGRMMLGSDDPMIKGVGLRGIRCLKHHHSG